MKSRELRMAYVQEIPALVSNLTVLENVLLPITYLGEMDEEQAVREAFILLNAAGVGWTAGMLPGRLSIEDRRTIAIVRSFMRRPRVALLDEPLSGMDDANLAGVRPLIKATLARGECAVLAAAADLEPFEGLPYRAVHIPGGWLPEDNGHEA